MSSTSGPSRRKFLARGAAVAAVPAVAALAGSALAEPASGGTLPDFAPIPPSALGPAVNAQGYFVGRVEKNLYWVTLGRSRWGGWVSEHATARPRCHRTAARPQRGAC